MPKYVNVNGIWKPEHLSKVNVNGIWKTKATEWVNVNGVWKSGGLPISQIDEFRWYFIGMRSPGIGRDFTRIERTTTTCKIISKPGSFLTFYAALEARYKGAALPVTSIDAGSIRAQFYHVFSNSDGKTHNIYAMPTCGDNISNSEFSGNLVNQSTRSGSGTLDCKGRRYLDGGWLYMSGLCGALGSAASTDLLHYRMEVSPIWINGRGVPTTMYTGYAPDFRPGNIVWTN